MNEFIIPLIMSLFVGAIAFGGFGLLMDEAYSYYQDHEADYQGFIKTQIEWIYSNYRFTPIVFMIVAFVGTYTYMGYRRGAY